MGGELGVLPGMDTIFSALELEKFVGFLNNKNQKNNPKYNFDIIVYDGLSTEETIRLIGATGKSRFQLSLSNCVHPHTYVHARSYINIQ